VASRGRGIGRRRGGRARNLGSDAVGLVQPGQLGSQAHATVDGNLHDVQIEAAGMGRGASGGGQRGGK
jgi:hypothetical protein